MVMSEVRVMSRTVVKALAIVVWLAAALFSPQRTFGGPFPDKNLEEAIRAVLKHEPKVELTDEKLQNVYILEAPGKEIKDLTGLEKCKNLALLKLTKNQISDLGPLKGLANLQSLDLADNTIVDIAPLADVKALQYLELSNNQVADITPLGNLTSLTSLYLTNNKIVDIGPVASLSKLSTLVLAHNQVRDLSALSKVTRLRLLDLKENQIEDLGPLKGQTELSMIFLQRNQIRDLTPLVEMAKADSDGPKRMAPFLRLYLEGNPLSDQAKSTQLRRARRWGSGSRGEDRITSGRHSRLVAPYQCGDRLGRHDPGLPRQRIEPEPADPVAGLTAGRGRPNRRSALASPPDGGDRRPPPGGSTA